MVLFNSQILGERTRPEVAQAWITRSRSISSQVAQFAYSKQLTQTNGCIGGDSVLSLETSLRDRQNLDVIEE